ncbi:MAG: bi-domain-containing oxidoreductase [Pirellulales bacterium]|nr:bi-domain-containing oxidoreductase [Pirellulales bacterium]
MKQIVQNLRSGQTEMLDVPCPRVGPGHLLIQSRASLISVGTERMLVEFGRAGLLAKAKQQPEKVHQVLDKIKTDGLIPTLEAVFSKLDEPMALGYCNAGVVVETGDGVRQLVAGDRVVSNGPHAEFVHRPVNLCAKIPDAVGDDQAPFAVLGAIGLQGIRLLQPAIGERVAVFGLGLIGLLAVQLLSNSGARVLGLDYDRRRLDLARQFGADVVDLTGDANPLAATEKFTAGRGLDGVLITAAAKDDKIVSQSAQMSRKRGRIVLVGTVNLELNRSDFYEKELSFQVSCSYGPGRYDRDYEDRGIDYPYPYVRWTEQRNIEAVLHLLAAGRLDVSPLITRRLPSDAAADAYDLLVNDRTQLGIVLEYPKIESPRERIVPGAAAPMPQPAKPAGSVRVGIIGAGNFARRVLLPALAKTPAELKAICSASGVTASHAARKFGISTCTTDTRAILDDPEINAVVIATPHDSHARLAAAALRAGKHVFVEKPLAIDEAGIKEVLEAYDRADGLHLAVGFNRRFSPLGRKMRELLAGRSGPANASILVNAGAIPADHWTRDPKVGGGRLIGEGCHWIDFMAFLLNQSITHVSATKIEDCPGGTADDTITVTLRFSDGSTGTLQYISIGHRSFPKERITVFADGRVLELDNFRTLRGWGWPSFSRKRLWFGQDKGHTAELSHFIDRVNRVEIPRIQIETIKNITSATLLAVKSLQNCGLVFPLNEQIPTMASI